MKDIYVDELMLGVSVGDYIGLRIGNAETGGWVNGSVRVADSYYNALVVGKVIRYTAKPAAMFRNPSGELTIEVPGGKRLSMMFSKAGYYAWRLNVDILLWLDEHHMEPKPAGVFQFVIFESPSEVKEALERYIQYQTKYREAQEARKKLEEQQKQAEVLARIRAEKLKAGQDRAAASQLDSLFRDAGRQN